MRVLIALAAIVAVAGCKTAGDVRLRNLVERSETTRTVSDVAGCIALAATGRQIELGSEAIPNGQSVSIAMRVAGVKTVMSVYDVEDIGGVRRVSFYSVGGRSASPKPLSGRAASCL